MSIETCRACGKKEEVPYFTSWFRGLCPACSREFLRTYKDPDESNNGAGCYDHDSDFGD